MEWMLERVFSRCHELVDTPGGDGGSLVGDFPGNSYELTRTSVDGLVKGGMDA
jgi:hypothetical protein